MNKRLITLGIFLFSIFVISFGSAAEPSVCCEKTTSGLFCQDVPSSECVQGATMELGARQNLLNVN